MKLMRLSRFVRVLVGLTGSVTLATVVLLGGASAAQAGPPGYCVGVEEPVGSASVCTP